jgi:hypothetical protein
VLCPAKGQARGAARGLDVCAWQRFAVPALLGIAMPQLSQPCARAAALLARHPRLSEANQLTSPPSSRSWATQASARHP